MRILKVIGAVAVLAATACYEPPPEEEIPPMWYFHNGPTTAHLYDVASATRSEVWAVGENEEGKGEILRYGGYVWKVETLPAVEVGPLYAVAVTPGGDVWAAGGGDYLLRWDGLKWDLWPHPSPGKAIYGLAMLSDFSGWAVGEGGSLWWFDGTAWEEKTSPTTNTLWRARVISEDSVWAAGDAGTVLHWGGSNWEAVTFPPTVSVRDLFFTADDDGWAVGSLATLYHWDGSSFSKFTSPDDDINYRCCGFATPGLGWAGGDQMRVARFEDSTWSVEENLPSGHWRLNAIHFVSAGEGWAMGDDGFILHYH